MAHFWNVVCNISFGDSYSFLNYEFLSWKVYWFYLNNVRFSIHWSINHNDLQKIIKTIFSYKQKFLARSNHKLHSNRCLKTSMVKFCSTIDYYHASHLYFLYRVLICSLRMVFYLWIRCDNGRNVHKL